MKTTFETRWGALKLELDNKQEIPLRRHDTADATASIFILKVKSKRLGPSLKGNTFSPSGIVTSVSST